MDNLSESMEIQFVVTPAGKAMILYRGDFKHSYSWAQYEPLSKSVELVSDEGEIDSLGHQIPAEMERVLDQTREVFLVQMNAQNAIVKGQLIKFTALGE